MFVSYLTFWGSKQEENRSVFDLKVGNVLLLRWNSFLSSSEGNQVISFKYHRELKNLSIFDELDQLQFSPFLKLRLSHF